MLTREIVLDTETTGLEPGEGHRVVEIGAVEIVNRVPTGATFHQYLDPERDMPAEAFAVHGLSNDFLRGKPRFDDVADAFVAFLDDSPLVIHNAPFDMKFLDAELRRARRPALGRERAVDTLMMARKRFGRASCSLDSLCKRFGVDRSARMLHGALLDSELLAEVYLHLTGGRQPGLELSQRAASPKGAPAKAAARAARAPIPARQPRPPLRASAAERARHAAFVATMKEPLWEKDEA